jgi:hypothetical protein
MARSDQGDWQAELSIKVRDISISRSNVSNLQLCQRRTLRGSKQRTAILMLRRDSPTIMKATPHAQKVKSGKPAFVRAAAFRII